jgi:phosphoribosyl-ATP pyrophosphohydrolase/phosphoribosyl-AMP cyclohydrolase/histidinol dehydrogenase
MGSETGMAQLMTTLKDRRDTAPEGSYTKRLYEDAGLLKDKLVEEAIELSEATEKDHVAAEAADVVYFTLVACAKAGVELNDIDRHLTHRHFKVRRRAGDAKPDFLNKHLNGGVTSGLRRLKPAEVPHLHRDPGTGQVGTEF